MLHTSYTKLHIIYIYDSELNQRVMTKYKKAQRALSIGDFGTVAMTLVVMAVILGAGATALGKLKGINTVNSSGFNATVDGIAGINNMAEFIPTISIIMVAGVVIGIIIMFFGRGRIQ